jgi:Family of unknown function (DUF6516)
MGDPHDWNSWDKYSFIHDKRLAEHAFVREWDLGWRLPQSADGTVLYAKLEGKVLCHGDVSVTVYKLLETRYFGHRRALQVRGAEYSYNAHLVGKDNLLRYDNGHDEDPTAFHRHEFDPETGRQLRLDHLKRDDMPTLADFLDEVARMVGFSDV